MTGSFCISVKTVDGKPVGGKAPEMLKKFKTPLLPTLRHSARRIKSKEITNGVSLCMGVHRNFIDEYAAFML